MRLRRGEVSACRLMTVMVVTLPFSSRWLVLAALSLAARRRLRSGAIVTARPGRWSRLSRRLNGPRSSGSVVHGDRDVARALGVEQDRRGAVLQDGACVTGPRWLPRGNRWWRRPITRSCEDWPPARRACTGTACSIRKLDGDAGYLGARRRKRRSQVARDPGLLLGAELAVSDHGVVAAFDVPGAEYLHPGTASLCLDEASADERLGFVGVLDADGHHGLPRLPAASPRAPRPREQRTGWRRRRRSTRSPGDEASSAGDAAAPASSRGRRGRRGRRRASRSSTRSAVTGT